MELSNYIRGIHHISNYAFVDIEPKMIGAVKSALTLTSTSDKQFTVTLFKSTDSLTKLGLPRGLFDYPTDKPLNKEWNKINMKFKGNLRPEQIPIVESTMQYLSDKNGCIVKASLAVGKTVIGINLMAKIGLKTLIVVPTTRVFTQWVEELKLFSNLEEKNIGVIKQNKCDVKGKSVVIAQIHSLAKHALDGHYPIHPDEFGLVIYDEIHMLGAETFSRTAPMFWSKYRIGLSGTPRRKDGMENVFFYHIGKIAVDYSKINIKPNIIIANYNGGETSHTGCVWGGKLSLGRYFNKVSRSYNRNEKIVNLIVQTYQTGREILILTDRLKQISDIEYALIHRKNIPAKDIGKFTNSIKQPDRRILLATYGSAGLGANIPRLDTLIFATPRVDIEQAVGRILRKQSYNKHPIVIDIVDNASSIMQGWSKARMKHYKIISDKINYITL